MRRGLMVFTLVVLSLWGAAPAQANLRPYYFLPWEGAMTGVPGSRVVTVGNSQGKHAGIDEYAWDFGGNDWQVRAARTGTVIALRDSKNPGNPTCDSDLGDQANYVRILHPDGDESLYTHLKKDSVSALGISVGQTIVRHSIIGRTDSSGWVCGAHLHYQVQQSCTTTSGFCQSLASSFLDENVVAQNPTDGVPQTAQTVISENLYEFEPDPPWDPQGWENFYSRGEPASGDLTSGSDSASFGEGHVAAFARDANLNLAYRERTSTSDWGSWQSLGAPTGKYLVGGPAAVSWNTGAACGTQSQQQDCHMDVFALASDGQIWQRPYRNTWTGFAWGSIGAPQGVTLLSDPDVSSWAFNRLDVFVRDSNFELWHKVWNGSWNAWENLCDPPYPNCVLSSSPSAVSWGSNRIDVFGRGVSPQNDLYWRVWNGSSWVAWVNLCGFPYPDCYLTSAPDASSWSSNRLHVFVRGSNNHLFQRTWNGDPQWANFVNLCSSPYPNCNLNSDPGAVSWGWGRIDVFGLDTAYSMVQRRYGA